MRFVFLSLLMTGVAAYRPKEKNYSSMKEASHRINQLASPDAILSEADSRSYVDAMADQWGVDDPSFESLRERTARAELRSLREPSTRISEDGVAKGFNLLMREIGAPREMQITGEQVHSFRHNYSAVASGSSVYPNMFARRIDGSIDDHCRPVEALYLIFLLQYGPNVEASKSTLMDSFRKETNVSSSRGTLATLSTRESEYSAAVDRYFRKHSASDFAAVLDRALDELFGVRG